MPKIKAIEESLIRFEIDIDCPKEIAFFQDFKNSA